MANEVLRKFGTAKTWRGATGDYGISIENVATNAAAQGAKGDLGEKWAAQHLFEIVIETGASAPTAGGSYELWWASSISGTVGNNNPGGTSGADAAYKGGEVDEWKIQLQYIGSLVVTNDASTIMRQYIVASVSARYGMPVVVNKTSQTNEVNHDEHYIAVHPIIDEIQAEA